MNQEFKKPMPRISGSGLKLIAMCLMLADHTALFILSKIDFFAKPFLILAGKELSLNYIIRLLGRIAFPLYAFLLVEGFIHTKDRKKYGRDLFIFALISEIPWNFIHTGGLFCSSQNVMFTLFFSYLALCAIEYFENNSLNQLVSLLSVFLICSCGNMDYGVRGLGLVLIIYLLRTQPILQAILGSCILSSGWFAGLAFIPINLYNGDRGFIRGKTAKYICYLFYPIHLLILGFLRYLVN